MNKSMHSVIAFVVCLIAAPVYGQGGFWYPAQPKCPDVNAAPVAETTAVDAFRCDGDPMDTRNYRLIEYRRMFVNGTTPSPNDLIGHWRGVNKGIVELVGYKQFIKEILPDDCGISGDNVKVGQVDKELLRTMGWEARIDPATGLEERNGRFRVQAPNGRGTFGHGAIFSYREGGNKPTDPANLLVDKVVKIDDDHLLGRATAKFGPLEIPLAYFVLERMRQN